VALQTAQRQALLPGSLQVSDGNARKWPPAAKEAKAAHQRVITDSVCGRLSLLVAAKAAIAAIADADFQHAMPTAYQPASSMKRMTLHSLPSLRVSHAYPHVYGKQSYL
jgi:hypothetical protein